jgi:hypothetical protein
VYSTNGCQKTQARPGELLAAYAAARGWSLARLRERLERAARRDQVAVRAAAASLSTGREDTEELLRRVVRQEMAAAAAEVSHG